MRKKLLLVTIFAAGLGASVALADNGHGHGHGNQGPKAHCQRVEVHGTVSPQTFTVTLANGSKRLNLASGSQVVVQLGSTGQTIRFEGVGCTATSGSQSVLQVQGAELQVRIPHPPRTTTTGTTQTTTTAPTTTSH
ncbi:MAG TPA: hypothetical protein VFA24_07825 [Gaiellaceae bacterium]|nr:hypothetical protein [Gaiellaceae bacterium]